jgi:hypothetical protein
LGICQLVMHGVKMALRDEQNPQLAAARTPCPLPNHAAALAPAAAPTTAPLRGRRTTPPRPLKAAGRGSPWPGSTQSSRPPPPARSPQWRRSAPGSAWPRCRWQCKPQGGPHLQGVFSRGRLRVGAGTWVGISKSSPELQKGLGATGGPCQPRCPVSTRCARRLLWVHTSPNCNSPVLTCLSGPTVKPCNGKIGPTWPQPARRHSQVTGQGGAPCQRPHLQRPAGTLPSRGWCRHPPSPGALGSCPR